jgi:hypothetical protein
MKFVTDIKMPASYLLTIPEGVIIMEKQLHHVSIHPAFTLSRNTIIKKSCHRQLALKYDADSKVLDKS